MDHMQVLNCSVHKFPSALSTPPHIQTSQLHTHFSDEYSKALSALYKVQKKKKKKNLLAASKLREAYSLPKPPSFPCWNLKETVKKAELQERGHTICKDLRHLKLMAAKTHLCLYLVIQTWINAQNMGAEMRALKVQSFKV